MDLLRMNGLPPLSHGTSEQNAAFQLRHDLYGSGFAGDPLSALPSNLALLHERGLMHEAAPFSSSNLYLSSLLHPSMPHGLSTSTANPLQAYWTQSHHGTHFPFMHYTEPHFSQPVNVNNVDSVNNNPALQQQLLVALLQSAAAVQHGLGDLPPPSSPSQHPAASRNATESSPSGAAVAAAAVSQAATDSRPPPQPPESSSPSSPSQTDQFSCLMAAIAQMPPPGGTETTES
jgi:hypothetical protein